MLLADEKQHVEKVVFLEEGLTQGNRYDQFGSGHEVDDLQALDMETSITLEGHGQLLLDKLETDLAPDKDPVDVRVLVLQTVLKGLEDNMDEVELRRFGLEGLQYQSDVSLVVIIPQT